MVLDSSVLLAILLDEPEAQRFSGILETHSARLLSAVSLVETSTVLEARKGPAAAHSLDSLIRRAGIRIAAVDEDQAEIARIAYRQFGKGRHPAGLNLGDCFAYALAKQTGEPLLFKGADFDKTDIGIVP